LSPVQVMSDTVHISAFQTQIHGTTILCQGPFPKSKQPPILESVQDLHHPFKRKVLLTNSPLNFSKHLSVSYDAVFQIREPVDWSLALTYILHCPKDVLVVAEDLPIPEALWPKLHKSITFVHIVSTPLKNLKPYQTVFFAPIEDVATGFGDTVFKALQQTYRRSYTPQNFKEIVQELRVAGASLAWTRIGEGSNVDGQGSLYWYDPVLDQGSDTLSKGQLADLFSWLSCQFR